MYSLVSLLSSIYLLPAMHSLLVTLYVTEYNTYFIFFIQVLSFCLHLFLITLYLLIFFWFLYLYLSLSVFFFLFLFSLILLLPSRKRFIFYEFFPCYILADAKTTWSYCLGSTSIGIII